MRIGYSYLRYSSPQQGDGDSVRRQTNGTADWCKRHDVRLDTNRTYLDRGKSAYHGQHRQRGGALAAFLAEVEAGQIPRGSVLIIENLDRLSRENPWDALPILCSLVNAGVSVVSLSPSEMVYERGSDLTALVLAVVEFGRGHSESESKSQRMTGVWEEKRRAVREDGALLTRKLPGWIEERGGKPVLIPARVKVVRRMFDLALKGYGLSLIVRELTRDVVPTWGRGKAWSKAYVHKILTGRAVLGELQPVHGDPVIDYYPAVVDEATWLQAQAALARRKDKPGPVGEKVATLFGGLLRDAATQDRLLIAWQTRGTTVKGRSKRRVLVTAASLEGAAPSVSFPNDVFEEAVLSLLREVNPADVLGKEPESESTAVAAELVVKEQRARRVETELVEGGDDVPALVRVLRTLSEECNALRRRLAEARLRENNPRSAAWVETMTLLDVAQDESHRLRLRDLLRTVIEEIHILIVPRKSHRLAAVQITFYGGTQRHYLIHYQTAGFNRRGGWSARSSTLPTLDFRVPENVSQLETLLNEIDLQLLTDAMR